jgi:molybdopterin-dependent oxidoreductase alpha subunit
VPWRKILPEGDSAYAREGARQTVSDQKKAADPIPAGDPQTLAGTRVAKAEMTAAGLPAILETARISFGEMGVAHTVQALTHINQRDGFDCQSCAWGNPDRPKFLEFCENGAKAVADEATKKRITPEFFATYSIAELSQESDYWLNAQGRLTEPMMLRRGCDHYEPISWDAAFGTIAGELRALDSPDQAVFYTSGKTTNEPAFLFQLLARQLGTNNLPDCSNMCHESSGAALTQTIGTGKGTVTINDFEASDLLIIFGNNPGTNHPRMLTSLEAAKRNGAKIIAVNPLPETGLMRFIDPNPQNYKGPFGLPLSLARNGTALADLYLPVRINGDVAVVKGIMKYMLEEEEVGHASGIDREFIAQYTSGYEALAADIKSTPWSEILEGCGLAKDQIEAAARMCVTSRAMICVWAMGLTQQNNAMDNVAQIVNLLLLGGHVGRPGAGACPVRGHSNVQGCRTMGIWQIPTASLLEAVQREFGFTPPQNPGVDVVESIHAMHAGNIRFFFAISGNLLTNAPDTAYTADAMRRCKLTVYASTKLNRSHLVTGEQALILPVIGRSERDVQDRKLQFTTVEDSMGQIGMSRGSLPPASLQLMSDVALICAIGERLFGDSPVPWRRFATDYDIIRDAIARVIPGFSDFNRRIRSEKTFYLPNSARERHFATPSGKALFTVTPIPKHDLRDGEYLMMTIRSHDQFNSTIYGSNDRYRGVYGGRRVIFMNPDDVTAASLKAGDRVDIQSHFQGETRVAKNFLVVPYTIPRRCTATYYPEANVLVPVGSVSETSNQPASKCVLITLMPSSAPEESNVDVSTSAIEYNLKRELPAQA